MVWVQATGENCIALVQHIISTEITIYSAHQHFNKIKSFGQSEV